MVQIPPGSFIMGVPKEESVRERTDDDDARPQHEVTFRQGFLLAKYPVTRGEFAAFVTAAVTRAAGDEWRNPGLRTDRSPSGGEVSAIDAEA